MTNILALDFGGTKLTAAVANTAVLHTHSPLWQAHKQIFTPADGHAQFDINIMLGLAREVLAGEEVAARSRRVATTPFAVGVSFGGPADYATGMVRLSHHVPGWEDIPLQKLLEIEFKTTVRIDNDANAGALGEWQFGAGRGYDDLLYITVSTGVGGGWVLGGRPFRGHGRMAGEIGHMVVDPNGPVCLCGKQGCVERLVSGPYMAADWAEERRGRGAEVTGREVAEMAMNGDVTAVRLLDRSAWALGVGIGNAANLINPQRVVLGGGVTKSGERWWEIVRQTAHATALPQVQFDIVPAALGDDAPLWGAVALPTLFTEREDNR